MCGGGRGAMEVHFCLQLSVGDTDACVDDYNESMGTCG